MTDFSSRRIAINISAADGGGPDIDGPRIDRLLRVLENADIIAKSAFRQIFPSRAIRSFHNYKELLEIVWADQWVPEWQKLSIAAAWGLEGEIVIEHHYRNKPDF
jgi:vacuolar-type H+-ATPase catalytic subunit A/Vma1